MTEQTRQGPNTFSIESDNPVASSVIPQLGAPTVQPAAIAPGLSAGAAGVSDAGAKTFRAISDLASGILAPKIKEAAQEQYIQGVQRAMTGEALGEIIKDQPWYTDIFAPSSALAGARAYTTQAALAKWAGKMQEQMPALAKVGPEQLNSAAVGAMQGFMTGDAAADSLITAGVVEHMAPLFKQHAKEHYVYMQKQASEAQINAWEASGKVYQGLAAAEASGKGTVSPQDKEAAKARLLSSITPFADQSDESYERNIMHFMEGAASSGNFQVVKLFKESGLYDKINPDKRAQLDRSLSVFGRKALDQAMPTFAVDVASLVRDMTQNPRDIPIKVQALNARAAAITGVTETDLIPLGSLDNIIGNVMAHQAAAALANQPKPPDAGPAIAEALFTQGPGAVDQAIVTGLVKEKDAEQAGLKLWQASKDPAVKAQVLNARTLKALDTVKSEFVNTLRADEFHPGVGNMAQVYQGMADNVRPLYFDEHQRALMDRFNAQVRAGTPPEAAWATTRVSHNVSNFMLPESAKDEVSKAIRKYVESENESWYFANKVDDAALRTIEAVTNKAFKADRGNNPVDVAVARAYAQAKSNGLDVQGKHAIINARSTDRALYAVVGEGQEATAKAFETLMAEKAKALGAELDNYEAIRAPDRNGQAFIYVNATDKNGKTVSWDITSQEIKAHVIKGIKPKAHMGHTPAVTGLVTDLTE